MAVVAGVDFGTLSTRVTLLDSARDAAGKVRGRLGTASASYPLHRTRDDPDFATQSHADQMNALVEATRRVLAETGINAADVQAIAIDTTGSSVIPVDAGLQPLGSNLYKETAASGTPVVGVPGDPGFATVSQGYLESSNVDPVKEIADLIQAQRAYEMNSKVIQAADQMGETLAKGIR